MKEIESSSTSLQTAASPKRETAPPMKILTRPPGEEPKRQISWREKPKQQQQHESWRKSKSASRQNIQSSPDHSLDDSRSIQSSSTASSRILENNQNGRGGGGRGRGNERGGRGRHGDRGGGRGRNSRGRGGRKGGRVQAGKTSVVRTSSGNIEYHVSLEEEPKIKSELMPNGTVRLSRKKKKNHKQQQHTSIQTSLEIGKPPPQEKK